MRKFASASLIVLALFFVASTVLLTILNPIRANQRLVIVTEYSDEPSIDSVKSYLTILGGSDVINIQARQVFRWADDGRYLIYQSERDDVIYAWDSVSARHVALSPRQAGDQFFRGFASNGEWVHIASASPTRAGTQHFVSRLRDGYLLPIGNWRPSWSDDGNWIVIHDSTPQGDTITLMHKDANDPIQALQSQTPVQSVQVSPQGTYLTFLDLNQNNPNGIFYRIRRDGSDSTQIVEKGNVTIPRIVFSPDEQWLFYIADNDPDYEQCPYCRRIFSQNVTTDERTFLGYIDDAANQYWITPNGDFAIFQSPSGLVIVASDGTQQVSLSGNLRHHPVFSSDGRSLIYFSDANQSRCLYRVSIVATPEPFLLACDIIDYYYSIDHDFVWYSHFRRYDAPLHTASSMQLPNSLLTLAEINGGLVQTFNIASWRAYDLSPNNDEILFQGLGADLYIVRFDGSQLERLFTLNSSDYYLASWDESLAWSVDAKTIAFVQKDLTDDYVAPQYSNQITILGRDGRRQYLPLETESATRIGIFWQSNTQFHVEVSHHNPADDFAEEIDIETLKRQRIDETYLARNRVSYYPSPQALPNRSSWGLWSISIALLAIGVFVSRKSRPI